MNEIEEKENVIVENLIYEIRGKEVMLDSDLAKLYNVETKRINEAVRRNLDKFPTRFSWILNEKDILNLRSQFATSSLENSHGGRRYDIRVFTEQGVAMLATVLKSKVATEISIKIMDALYHFGASFKDLGTKCFAISKIKNKEILDKILQYIN